LIHDFEEWANSWGALRKEMEKALSDLQGTADGNSIEVRV